MFFFFCVGTHCNVQPKTKISKGIITNWTSEFEFCANLNNFVMKQKVTFFNLYMILSIIYDLSLFWMKMKIYLYDCNKINIYLFIFH